MTPEQIKRVHASFDAQSMMARLGARMTAMEDGTAEIAAEITDHVTQQQGYAHGGLAFAIGDSAAGYAALTLLPLDREVVTSEMSIHFLAPAQGGRLIAMGRVIKPGRRQLVVRADVWHDADDRQTLIATLTGTMVTVGV